MTIKAYLVGGAVRDSLLGRTSKDLDYAVEAPSYDAMVEWIKTQGKIFLETPQHYTVRAHLKGKQPADYVLCRQEGPYSDGRRPDWVKPGSLEDDLARRDFTVNAIALDEDTGTYIDPHGGREHLKQMKLYCVGNPYARFSEDALRMLRAMRFIITKGFSADFTIWEAMRDPALIKLLSDNISVDRKRDELYRCFAYDTLFTMEWLSSMHYTFRNAVFKGSTGPLWLEPTSKTP
jgi:tRNA nucleotidyltransferase (CCA-adding enzyme)